MSHPTRFSLLLFLFLTVLTALPARAQLTTTLQIKAGISQASIKGLHNETVNTDRRTGLAAGAGLVLDWGGPVALQPELLFSQKGSVEKSKLKYGSGSVTHIVSYIELPLLAKLQLPGLKTFSPFLHGGPTVGVKVNEQIGTSGGAIACACGGFKRTELGLAVGGGVTFPAFRGHHILLDARYTQGLTSISGEHTYGNPAHQGKNHAFVFMVGLGL